ncbi:MAG: hypothetical protein Q9162_002942 [Coniocarpon cinnabarinum]
MSKRGAEFQATKDNPDPDSQITRIDAPVAEPRTNADAKTMASRRVLNPKSRKRPGGGAPDLSSLGNPFAQVGASSPAPANPFANVTFGGNTQSQSFPAPNGGNSNSLSAPQNSSFPPSQNGPGNIFNSMNGSSSFTFGGNNPPSNPFAQASQQAQSSPDPATTPKFNLFQSPQSNAPTQQTNLFGSSQSQSQPNTSVLFGQQPSTPSGVKNQNSVNGPSGDATMASPPSNKQSDPLGIAAQPTSASQSSTASNTFNPFGNVNGVGSAASSAAATSNTSGAPTLFGDSAAKYAQNPFASKTNNLFGGANQAGSGAAGNTSSPSNLFGNLKPASNEKTASAPSSNLFGGFPQQSQGQTGVSASSNSSTPSLFPPTPNTTSSTSNTSGSTLFPPSVSASASSPLFYPALQNNASNNKSQFGEASGKSGQENRKLGTAPLFGSQGMQAGTDQPGGSSAPTVPGSSSAAPLQQSNSSSTHNFSITAAEGDMKKHYQRLNSNIRSMLLRMDTTVDWASALSDMLTAYRSATARLTAQKGQAPASAGTWAFGNKRKEPADPPAEATRPSKAPHNTSTPSQSMPGGDMPSSQTSRMFSSIVGDASKAAQKSQDPITQSSSLFSKPSNSNNLFGSSAATGSNLFGAGSPSTRFGSPKTSSTNIFGHLSNSNETQEEDEGSDEGEAVDDVSRQESPAPGTGGSLFDRISGGPPPKENATSDGSSWTVGNVEPSENEGDHTWTPEKPINFGDSVNGTPSTKNNIFGASKPSPSLFNFSSTPKPSENSLFVPKPNATNQSSRASTPGTDVNGVSASEAEGEASGQDNEVTNGEVTEDRTAMTAEELNNEDVLYEVPKVKMIQFGPKPGNEEEKEWKARGTGPLRVLRNKKTGSVRMLHRISPRGVVLINSSLPKNAMYKKLPNKGALSIGATGSVDGREKTMSFQQWTARMASDDVAKELLETLEANKENA